MKATDVLEAAEHAGAHLYLRDGVIRAGSARHLSPELRAAITDQKADLVVLLREAELDEPTDAPAMSKYEADSDPNVLLMIKCLERWPDRAEEWRDVDWGSPVEVGTRVLGCRLVPSTDADQAEWEAWRAAQPAMPVSAAMPPLPTAKAVGTLPLEVIVRDNMPLYEKARRLWGEDAAARRFPNCAATASRP